MAEAQPQPTSSNRSRKKKTLLILGIVGALLLAAVVGGIVRWLVVRNQHIKEHYDPKALPAVVTDVQNLRLDGNTAAAEQQINDALNNPKTSDKERYMLYIQQGSAAADQGNTQAAIDAYQKAAAIQETFEIVQLLAPAYAQVGNKDSAITYYRKAIQLVPQKDPVRDATIAGFTEQIVALGGQP